MQRYGNMQIWIIGFPRPHRVFGLETVTRRMWRVKMAASETQDTNSREDTRALPIVSESTAQPPSHIPAQPASAAAVSAVSDQTQLQELHKQAAKQAQTDRVHRFLAELDQSLAEGDQHVAFKTLTLLRRKGRL